MEFQCVSWYACDRSSEGFEDSEDNEYIISIFGRSQDGKSVCAHVSFQPYFFVEIPNHWNNSKLAYLTCALKDQMRKLKHDIVNVAIVERKKFYGFTNNEQFKFARIIFKTHAAFKKASWILKKHLMTSDGKILFQVYEANIDPMLRFCHVQDIQLAGWVRAEKYSQVTGNTHTDIEIMIDNRKYIKPLDKESIAPIVQASFDIETYSHDGGFPDANDINCPCIQIATTLQRYGDEQPYKRHLISLDTCDAIDGVEVIECKSEREVLEVWSDLIRSERVDVLIGYNIWGFDLHYMWTRATITNASDFFKLGNVCDIHSSCKATSFSSGAYGDSDYQMVDTVGRLQIDLLVIMKREHKLTSYSLNAVSEHFLKDKKVDMPYKLMFEKYKGNSKDRQEIGVYCVKDTDLPLTLMNKLAIIPNMFEMAKATWVPLSFLQERGQGIKIFSLLTYKTRKENQLVITLNREKVTEDAPYEGATVLQAKKGAYMEDPITGLDFASLYPTIMRAHNLCHSTLVMDEKYDNLPGIEYYQYGNFRFSQNEEGILPKMLRELAVNRKLAKKDMAKAGKEGNYFMKAVYNGKQLAFKVTMNSTYGFCGAVVGFLPCKPVAEATTGIGRGMIEHTKNKVEEWYPGADVVYGDTDSVMVKFDNGGLKGKDALKRSFELGLEAADRISATFKEPIELEFEKVYFPYLLFSKKRYAGLMYTNPNKPDYIDAKGIQIVRRDNCPFVKHVSQKVLDKIMYDLDTDAAIQIVRDATKRLLNHEIPIDDLVVSKSLKRISYVKSEREVPAGKKMIKCKNFYLVHEYANANQPHITVARKREEREAGTGPKTGDRVPHVFLDTGNNKHLQFEKAEDPAYAKENDSKIDVVYYLHHGLESPLVSLFEVFLENPKEELFSEAFNSYIKHVNRQVDIYKFLGIS